MKKKGGGGLEIMVRDRWHRVLCTCTSRYQYTTWYWYFPSATLILYVHSMVLQVRSQITARRSIDFITCPFPQLLYNSNNIIISISSLHSGGTFSLQFTIPLVFFALSFRRCELRLFTLGPTFRPSDLLTCQIISWTMSNNRSRRRKPIHGIAFEPEQIQDDIILPNPTTKSNDNASPVSGSIQMTNLFVTMCFFARLGFVQVSAVKINSIFASLNQY